MTIIQGQQGAPGSSRITMRGLSGWLVGSDPHKPLFPNNKLSISRGISPLIGLFHRQNYRSSLAFWCVSAVKDGVFQVFCGF